MSNSILSEREWARGNKSEELDLQYTAQLSNNKAKESWLLQEGARDPNKDLTMINAQLTKDQAKDEYQCKSRDKVEILEDGTREYVSIKTAVAIKGKNKTNYYLPLRVAVGNLDENGEFIVYNAHDDLNDVYRALNVKYVDIVYPKEIIRLNSCDLKEYIYLNKDGNGRLTDRILKLIENKPYCYTEGEKNSTGWIIGYENRLVNNRHIQREGCDASISLVIGLRENYPTNLKDGELPRLDRPNRWPVFLLLQVNPGGAIRKRVVSKVTIAE